MALENYPNYQQCTTKIKTTQKKIVLREKKNLSQFILVNDCQKEIYKTQVDGCLNIEGKKCDFLLIIKENSLYLEIYVELKGNKVDYAIKQLEATIKKLAESNHIKKYCFIVATKVPRTTQDLENAKRRFKKQYNAILQVKSRQYEQPLSKLI